jgi:hypothetical protein
MLKRTCSVLLVVVAILIFGEEVAAAAAKLIIQVIIAPASEPITMLSLGSGLLLVAGYWRKNINKK